MAGKDYYKTLGVDKQSSAAEIKKKYRKLALKYHPDQNQGDKAAEQKFKEINEAYAVLSDADKRKKYDMFGADGFNQRFSTEDIFSGFDPSSLFRDFGFGGSGAGFENFFGSGFRGRSQGGRHPGFGRGGPSVKGKNIESELYVTLENAFEGAKKSLMMHGQSITVTIPRGIESGQKLRLNGKGASSQYGGPAGDLYLKITFAPHKVFECEGKNLKVKKTVSLPDAVLGARIDVPTIEGGSVSVKIPAGTQPGSKMRLKGKGMPTGRDPDAPRGFLYVEIQVEIPKVLTEREKVFFEDMRSDDTIEVTAQD